MISSPRLKESLEELGCGTVCRNPVSVQEEPVNLIRKDELFELHSQLLQPGRKVHIHPSFYSAGWGINPAA
jgi:hypothetical protein